MPRSCASCSAAATASRIATHALRRHRRLEIDLFAQARPAEQLHHHEGLVGRVDVEVEDADDVRMAQLRAGAALAQEALARLRRRIRRGLHHLDRDLVAEARSAGRDTPGPCRPRRAGQNLVAIVDLGAGRLTTAKLIPGPFVYGRDVKPNGGSVRARRTRDRLLGASSHTCASSIRPGRAGARTTGSTSFSCTLFCRSRACRLSKSTRSSSWSWL